MAKLKAAQVRANERKARRALARKVPRDLGERVLAELRGPAFAVLDCARDRKVAALSLNWLATCLYRGDDLPRALASAAPHLLRLWPGQVPTQHFFEHGWGHAWGIALSYSGPHRVLYRQLRRYLRARTPRGSTVLFRYYDPRVLRVYLPTCTAGEIDRFLGPITSIAAESDEAGVFHLFRRCEGGIEELRVRAGQAGAKRIRGWETPEEPEPHQILPQLRPRQMRAFQEVADERWTLQMARMLRRGHAELVSHLSDEEIRRRCREALDRAAAHGLVSDGLFAFVLMTFTLSRRFDAHPAFQSVLNDGEIPGPEKMNALYERLTPDAWREARGMP